MQDNMINKQVADLAKAMLALESEEEAYRFFEDIFTIHELQAVAQRLAVARLLQKRSPIRRLLSVPARVRRRSAASTAV